VSCFGTEAKVWVQKGLLLPAALLLLLLLPVA
jgi:hypothetical protein